MLLPFLCIFHWGCFAPLPHTHTPSRPSASHYQYFFVRWNPRRLLSLMGGVTPISHSLPVSLRPAISQYFFIRRNPRRLLSLMGGGPPSMVMSSLQNGVFDWGGTPHVRRNTRGILSSIGGEGSPPLWATGTSRGALQPHFYFENTQNLNFLCRKNPKSLFWLRKNHGRAILAAEKPARAHSL